MAVIGLTEERTFSQSLGYSSSSMINIFYISLGDDDVNRNPLNDAIQIIQDKRRVLMRQLNKPAYPPEIQILVNRKRLVEDSFNAIMPWIGNFLAYKLTNFEMPSITRSWLQGKVDYIIRELK